MTVSTQLAKHFRDVYFGGNWTVSDMKQVLDGITWEEAAAKVNSLNSIALLTFHTQYFVTVLLKVLKGGPLEGHDKFSFDMPPLTCEQDWQALQDRVFQEVEACAVLIADLPDDRLGETFCDEKYGTYYRNIAGTIEHTHYHLGQIALIKKLVKEGKT
jgi:hypothetical protein